MTPGRTPRPKGDAIPASAYTPLLRITFGMIAVRRGPHWQLANVTAEQSPFGEALDEAELLAEAIAGVMKHVPLPTRELGIVSDLTTCAIAFYSVLTPRMALDKQIAELRAQGHEVRLVPTGRTAPSSSPSAPVARERPPAPPNGGVTAADVMESLGDEPIASQVTHLSAPDRVQTGDPIDDGVQLGYAPTDARYETGRTEDPEPVLFDAYRPGETPARVEDLVDPGGPPLLDRIAPAIEVDGLPAARELS